MSSQLTGIVASVEQRETIRSPIGGSVTFLARGEDTGGVLTALSVEVPPLMGPPLHVHKALDEAIYILAGDFRWRLGDATRPASAGSLVYVPRGLTHAFQNVGSDDGTMLITFMPAGMEGFFERQADLVAFDLDTFRAEAAREGMDVLGPPLAVSDPL